VRAWLSTNVIHRKTLVWLDLPTSSSIRMTRMTCTARRSALQPYKYAKRIHRGLRARGLYGGSTSVWRLLEHADCPRVSIPGKLVCYDRTREHHINNPYFKKHILLSILNLFSQLLSGKKQSKNPKAKETIQNNHVFKKRSSQRPQRSRGHQTEPA
jgi:hypothetical protein